MVEINCLIYDGEGVGQHCLPGTENALDKANIKGYTFKHTLEDELNATTMKGFDVIFLPGGNSARVMYKDNPNIDVKELKKYPTIGICSAGYIESLKVVQPDGSKFYDAWGITPHVTAINYAAEGVVNIKITEEGEAVLGVKGIIPMDHENGPAFSLTSGVVLATYADGPMAGKPAIVMDTDGMVNHILSGPHPELEPFYPDIVGRMVIAAYLGNNKGGDKLNYSIKDIAAKSDNIATFIKTNKRLPNYSEFNGKQISMAEYLYLAVSAVININKNQLSDVEFKEVADAPLPAASYTPGKQLSKTEYVQTAKNIQSYINTNGRAPNYATTSIGKLATNDLVFDYSLILSFYYAGDRNRLPNYVTINQISGSTTVSSDIIQELQDKTGKTINNFTDVYNLILKWGRYCNPMYLDDQKSFPQAQTCVINEINDIYDPNAYVQSPISGEWTRRDCMTCVDWTQWGMKIAKAQGYDVIPYGVYCPGDDVNHAIFTIKGREFSNWTIIDLAAAAAEGYPIGKAWCNPPTSDRAWPGWIPLE